MVVGYDLDGVLTIFGLYNIGTKLPWWCGLWLLLVPPNKGMVKELKERYADGQRITIITARHKQLEGLTRWWLKVHKIPFSRLACLGPGKNVPEKKLAAIKQFSVEVFTDDDINTVIFLRNAGIKTFHCKGGASC